MSLYYCSGCGGELVSCECPDVDDYAAEDYSPEYLCEDIDDRTVVWTVNDNNVGRIEIVDMWRRT